MKDERDFNKLKVGDYRKPLYPNINAIKPSVKTTVISKDHVMTDREIDRLYEKMVGPGPGTFKPEYKLTEKRADVGVPKIVAPNKEKEKPQIIDEIPLYPNVNAIKPNHMTFKYYEPL
jgi:hypothetical protein